MRQTTRSCAYSVRKAIFAPAPRRWALIRFSRSFPNWTVLGKKDQMSLEVAAAVPWFWRKDCQSVPTLVSFVYVSMGGMSGKHSAELKTPRRRGQHRRRCSQPQSERFYRSSAESLEVAFTLRLFLRTKARRVILSFSVKNDQGKKVWDNRIWTKQVLSWFSIRDFASLAMFETKQSAATQRFWKSGFTDWPWEPRPSLPHVFCATWLFTHDRFLCNRPKRWSF